MKQAPSQVKQKKEEKGLQAKYEMCRFLGNGSAGRVDLMKNRSSGQHVAVKQI
jgi:hypothetical protein